MISTTVISAKQTLMSPILWISILSFVISCLGAWFNLLKPGKIRACLSYLDLQRYSSLKNGVITDQFFVFCFALRNIGAKSVFIQNIRIKFLVKDVEFFAYPVRHVLHETIENRASYEADLRYHGSPFYQFILCKDEVRKNNYIFTSPKDLYVNLNGEGYFYVEIKTKYKWKPVTKVPYKCLGRDFSKMLMAQSSGDRLALYCTLSEEVQALQR